MRQPGLVGGCPSSGSTALVNWLNRSPDIAALPETGLFCHGARLVARVADTVPEGLHRTVPWVNSTAKAKRALGGPLAAFERLAENPWEISRVVRDRFGLARARLLVEKTPENVFAFRAFLSDDPANRVVLTSRDARAVVASLVRRGFAVSDAVLFWFAHCFEIVWLVRTFPDQVLHCRYRDFAADPEAMGMAIRAFWDLPDAPDDMAANAVTETAGTSTAADVARLTRQLEITSWGLEESAWRQTASDRPALMESENLLGLDLEILLDRLVFCCEGQRLRPRDLDDILAGAAWQDPGIAETACTDPPEGLFASRLSRALQPRIHPRALKG